MKIVVKVNDNAKPQTANAFNKWLASLSSEQYQELAALDHTYDTETDPRRYTPTAGIIRDWIEDHGGDRGWWYVFYTVVEKDNE